MKVRATQKINSRCFFFLIGKCLFGKIKKKERKNNRKLSRENRYTVFRYLTSMILNGNAIKNNSKDTFQVFWDWNTYSILSYWIKIYSIVNYMRIFLIEQRQDWITSTRWILLQMRGWDTTLCPLIVNGSMPIV